MPEIPPGGCSLDWDAKSWDGQGWHGLGCKDLFVNKDVIVPTFRKAGRKPATWRGSSIGMSKYNHVYKGDGSGRVDKLMQEKRNGTLV